jgi:hypothetical protein
MVPRIFYGFDQFMDNVLGSGQIRVPHAQINDILSSLPRLYLQLVHNAKDVRRQPHHSMKARTLRVKRIHIFLLQAEMSKFKCQLNVKFQNRNIFDI